MKKRRKFDIDRFILNFCKDISPEDPILVPLRPLPGKPPNECFSIVPEHIAVHGGEQKIGWSIQVWKRVLIEAEFHCIWESPEGEPIDITPKMYEADVIIFLPDPTKSYAGRQVDSIRKSISTDKDVTRFIVLCEEYFRYRNKGDLADYHGEIEIKDDFIEQYYLLIELECHLIKKYGRKRGISTGGRFIHYDMSFHNDIVSH